MTNKITITFPNNTWSIIKTICPSLEASPKENEYDRSAWQGTTEEWSFVSQTLRTMKNTASSNQKRSMTAAIKKIELTSGQGEYHQKYLTDLAAHKAACRVRHAARKAARKAANK